MQSAHLDGPPATEDHKILIVDDDPQQVKLLAKYLTLWGYQYVSAFDGQEAVQRLSEEKFTLVITDIMMPALNGMDLLAFTKKNCPDTDVVVVTAFSGKFSYLDVVNAGAADFIEKPISKAELEAKIARIIMARKLIRQSQNELRTQQVLNGLLRLSVENAPLVDILKKFLVYITSLPWLGLKHQGAVFFVDEETPNKLVLMAEHNRASELHSICAEVPFGHCLCGRAALSGDILFTSSIDERHENQFAGMQPHGHYCVPIKTADEKLLGIFTLYISGNLERNKNIEDNLLAISSTLAGIIQHRKALQAVKESENRCRAITDATVSAIIMVDSNGIISFWNPAAEKLFGYSMTEAIGKDLHKLLVPSGHKMKYKSALSDFFNTGLARAIEVTALHKDGTEIPIELTVSKIKLQGKWQGVGIITDIRERKQAEEEKEKLNRQLRQTHKMEAIGTLAGGIAHDFNNLLSAILGYSQMVMESITDKNCQAHADLERVLEAGYQAKELTKQILTFSRQTEQELIPVKMHLIVKESIRLLRGSIPSNIAIQKEIASDSGSVLADPARLHQIIMNLCTNAYYVMREHGGTLSVKLKNTEIDQTTAEKLPGLKEGVYVKLTVSDNGPGMQPDVLENIFNPFYTTKPQGEGTGMGLAIVHGIVTDLGGIIQVTSEPGKGTNFEVYLPSFFDLEAAAQKQIHTTALTGAEHILLVDDEMSVLDIVTRNLAKFGYDVIPRVSSIEALEAFRARPDKFDLVITDQAMPGMTGIDMAIEMLKIRPDIPVIIQTGLIDSAVIEYARQIGVKEVMVKPVEALMITKSIRKIMQEKADAR